MIERLKNRWHCFRRGYHNYGFDSPSMGGDWIRCQDCRHLEEYLPGVHEPKDYDYWRATPSRKEQAIKAGLIIK